MQHLQPLLEFNFSLNILESYNPVYNIYKRYNGCIGMRGSTGMRGGSAEDVEKSIKHVNSILLFQKYWKLISV